MEDQEPKFNPNHYVPAALAVGTWTFQVYCALHGISWVPDEWVLAVILSPYGSSVYSWARDKVFPVLAKKIPRIGKKD